MCGSAYPPEHYIGEWHRGDLPDLPRPWRAWGRSQDDGDVPISSARRRVAAATSLLCLTNRPA
jgi:hypothetical protein